jgi:hypothetical protein
MGRKRRSVRLQTKEARRALPVAHARVSAFCMFAILNARSVVVPCAYKTIGRAPVQTAPRPEGTISAPDAVVVPASVPDMPRPPPPQDGTAALSGRMVRGRTRTM